MRRRRQQLPWIHRNSRFILGAIASIGAIGTAYLTYIKLVGGSAACPTSGCNQVLSSPYATVFGGIPLTIFGFLAYAGMMVLALGPLIVKADNNGNRTLRSKLDETSWFLLFIGAATMTVFSGYLMYILTTEIQAACLYCIGSALLSLSLLTITLVGRDWDDIGQLLFTGIIILMVTLVGTLGIYSGVNAGPAKQVARTNAPPIIQTTSGPSEIALAQHLAAIGAKKFGAYWCPHCHDQQALFGQEAFSYIDYVECAQDGYQAQTDLCQSTGVTGFPSWTINGELYSGVRPLDQLADLSGYEGPRNFQN